VKPHEVIEALGPMFDLVTKRCLYLGCLKSGSPRVSSASVAVPTDQTAAAAAAATAGKDFRTFCGLDAFNQRPRNI
jgi:hypothetical protein